MKDLLRRQTSLSEEIEAILNEQVKIEAQSSALYLAMASWADQNGFENSAQYLMEQSEEERRHMLKIFQFINDQGGMAISPEVPAVRHDYASLKEVFEEALESEIKVTQAIHRIADKAQQSKDFTTFHFIQWFIQEQIEEEYVARRILELFEIIGDSGLALMHVDERIPKVSYQKPSQGAQ